VCSTTRSRSTRRPIGRDREARRSGPWTTSSSSTPHSRGLMTPPGYPDFEIHVPSGTGPRFAEQFAAIPVSQRIPWRTPRSSAERRWPRSRAATGSRPRRSARRTAWARHRRCSPARPPDPDRTSPPPSIGHGDLTRSGPPAAEQAADASSTRCARRYALVDREPLPHVGPASCAAQRARTARRDQGGRPPRRLDSGRRCVGRLVRARRARREDRSSRGGP
jgi:hypothetical protein